MDKQINFYVKETMYWDFGGRSVAVFRKGEVIKGILHENGEVTANSSIYPHIDDYVNTDLINIL